MKRSADAAPLADQAPASGPHVAFSSASPVRKLQCSGVEAAGPPAAPVVGKAAPVPSVMDVRAFGLEDRAEAVIALGSSGGWSLANLAQWRRETFEDGSGASPAETKASGTTTSSYLRQRQRAYRQQMLSRGAAPTEPASHSN